MSKFLAKQLEQAESKKLGRTECHYEMDKGGRFKKTFTRADAAKRPPLVRQPMVPVGTGLGVMKSKKSRG